MSKILVSLGGAGILWALLSLPLAAESSPRLDAVIPELESIVADLETGQSQSLALRQQLLELETLAADHQKTLESQAQILASYQKTVASLELHDRQALELAQSLREQLERERALNRWWVPVTVVACALAGLEAVALLWGLHP